METFLQNRNIFSSIIFVYQFGNQEKQTKK